MELSPTLSRFVLHWGEMGTRWGVNRTVAQIHALLYITGRPMHAEEIADTLGVARSNVSNSIRELQSWGLVRLVHLAGDRRDHFETSTHVWELVRAIVRERQRREIAPTIAVLRELLADPASSKDPAEARVRMRETLELLETLTAWSDEMLKLDTDTLMKVLKLGAKIKKLLGGAAGAASMGRGAASAAAKGRGAASAASKDRGAASAAPKGRGDPSAVPKGRGAASAAPQGRGDPSAAPKGRGDASAAPQGRGRARASAALWPGH